MMDNVNVIIEDEGNEGFSIFSPDINVMSNGESIEDAKKNFMEALEFHLECSPSERELLQEKSSCLITTIPITNSLERYQSPVQSF